MSLLQSKRRGVLAIVVICGTLLVMWGSVLVFQQWRARQGHRRAAEASMAMPMVQWYQSANGRWPGKPTDLTPNLMTARGAEEMERAGFEFVTLSDGSFVIRWDDQGVKRTMDMKLRIAPPLP